MTSRPSAISPGRSGSEALALHPPSIDLSDRLLSSAIPLPPNALIAYAVFSPTTAPTLHPDTVELARRHVLDTRKPSLLDSLLCTVHVEKGGPKLYIFSVSSSDGAHDPYTSFNSLQFDGLILSQISSFHTTEIHKSKSESSTGNSSTPQNTSSTPQPTEHSPFPSPAENLLIPYTLFLRAVQERLINDICSVQDHDRILCRLNGGFLIFPQHATSGWGTGWEHYAQNRPLIHTHLHVTLHRKHILVQPTLRPTHYLPIPPSCPLPPGTPITLLPYGTPAYFLTSYNGPTAGLAAQFDQSLVGLGCDSWVALASKPSGPPTLGANTGNHATSRDPRFLIAWIDDKGVAVIWPISLALAFLPTSSSPHASHHLTHLQPSPPPPAATVPTSSLTAAFAASPITSLGRSPPPPLSPADLPPALTRRPNVLGAASHNFGSRGLSSFQFDPDSSSRDDVRSIACEVSEYIEAVVKERERERERLRKERESSGSSFDASPARALSAVNTPGSVGISSPTSATLMGTTSSPPTIGPDVAVSSIAAPVPLSVPLSPGVDPSPQHPFYPSPPTNPEPPSSIETTAQPLSVPPTHQAFDPVGSSAPTIVSSPDAVAFSAASAAVPSFDTFPGFENWPQDATPWQSTGGILDMSLDDVNINVGMGIDSLPYNIDPIAGGGGNSGWGTGDMGRMDIDATGLDSNFTDADFEFWDDGKPQQSGISTVSASVPPSLGINNGTGLTQTAVPPLGISPQMFESSKPSAIMPSFHAPMWPPSAFADGLAPQSSVLDAAVELISSPTKTLPSPGPTTPHCISLDAAVRLKPRSPLAGGGIFDAIPFASTYRLVDGKYTAGKGGGWWNRYKAATDPRVGVMRKLKDIKCRTTVGGGREASVWARGSQEWTRNVMQTPPPEEGYTLSDDSETDEGEDEDMQIDEDDDEVTSPITGPRPFTPLPSYLPLGPTLLHTHFQHCLLLALSTPLHPSQAAPSPPVQTPGAVPVSVPTPVSPAALLGAASEKSKSLEAAAQILAKEVVESATWNDAWRANAVDCWAEHRCATEVWQADVHGPLDLQSVFTSENGGKPSLEQLEPPFFSVAKSEAVIQVLSSALRFWDKLGLSPRAGKKDVCAFVFFEESDEARVDAVDKWLQWVSSTYTRHNFGEHERGKSTSCVRNGLIPVKFETFRKTLSKFGVTIFCDNQSPPTNSNYVFYIAMPSSSISISSQTLRQVFSAVKRAQKIHPGEQILFQFVPAQSVYSLKFSSADRGGVFAFACSIYNRILSPVDRVMSQQTMDSSLRTRDFFLEPAFSLARPLHTKVQFVRQFPVLSQDVVDRHTLLHVGYQMSNCGKWLLVCCVDQRGEAHDLTVWLLPGESQETFISQHIWTFAMNFQSGQALTWVHHLDRSVPSCRELPMVHVSLMCVELDKTLAFIEPHGGTKRPTSESRSSKTTSGNFMIDSSSATYHLSHSAQVDLLPSRPAGDFESAQSYIADCSDTTTQYDRHIRPLHTTTLIRVPGDAGLASIAMLHLHQLHSTGSHRSSLRLSDEDTLRDVCRNYHELSVLAHSRWLKANPILPFHLGALEIMDCALSGSLSPPEA
ncbi:hypothetical protein BJV77DRAFT_1027850 [Russula vinacea]|nr:hypothetical protein BJV77DRAFT_1027850 [Russula vinacea]